MRKTLLFSILALLLSYISNIRSADAKHPNILFITVDDMSCDSIGVFGCELAGTSPNVDRLASEGIRFKHAHTVVGNCKPSRNVMWSGRYPHNNRVEGFYSVDDPDYPVLCDLMQGGGYFTGIRGKVSHSTPYSPYHWDIDLDTLPDGSKAHGKSIESYYLSTKLGIESAEKAGKPFCLIINVSDPHKPFYGVGNGNREIDDPNKPSRVFTADEVPVPKFLFDDPAVKKELAQYYSSVRRADDCVGAALKALTESGEEKKTVVLFLSDHGMPLPFAKTQLYHHSTNTPFIARWPGVIEPGTINDHDMISAVDLTPTLLDIAEIPHPEGFDGRSFFPLLKGENQKGRDMVFKEYNENSGGSRDPMRSVQTRDFIYIFNPWSNGERVMKTATQGTATYRKMQERAKSDEYIAGRLRLIDHRVLEELYDVNGDRDALHNLIDDPKRQETVADLRKALEEWMVRTGDPALEVFRARDRQAALDEFMANQEAESEARKSSKTKKQPGTPPKNRRSSKNQES